MLPTSKFFILVTLVFSCASPLAFAENCVKVRDGKEGYQCINFDQKEVEKAQKYGLKLGAKYKTVKKILIKHGWSINTEWDEEDKKFYGYKDGMLCGSGYDALCWTVYKKGKEEISLYFSGTNSGIPLISIEQGNSYK